MESEALNKSIVGRWFTSFWGDSPDLAVVDELAAPEVLLQYSMHTFQRGRLALRRFMTDFREAFPDLEFHRTGPLIADRDIVVVRWAGSGTHTGPQFEDFNVGPLPTASGRQIAFSGHTAMRLEGAMIVEEVVWSMERKSQLRPISGGLVLGLGAAAGASPL